MRITCAVVCLYLVIFVYAKWRRPRIRVNRHRLRSYVILYNVVVVVMNTWVLCTQNVDRFMWAKCIELNDTLLMLLRGSYKQITYTHLYHHSTSVLFVSMLRDNMDERIRLGVLMNGGTHMLLYTYYLLSYGLRLDKKKYLWWSKYITHLHLTQFLLNTFNCISLDNVITRAGFVYQTSLLCLYGRFFYRKREKSKN